MLIADVNLNRYEYTHSDDRLEYYFDSVGPRGVIRKVVKFQQVDNAQAIYNLAFGDLNEVTGEIDDSVKSNNGDKEMVIATVAATVIEFSNAYPSSFIAAIGLNKARTRLYQMAIWAHFAEISLMFEVFGYIDDEWRQFRAATNYEAFSVTRKRNIKI